MTYATVDGFISMFGEDEAIALSNLDDPQSVVVREDVITGAIADAESLINGYLRSAGYTLPLSTELAVLSRAACDIARYYLDRVKVREDVKARYDGWLTWLKDVARGTVNLDPGTGPEASTETGNSAESFNSGNFFTFDSLWDY